MSTVIIGAGGHKAAKEVRKQWDHLTPEQRQIALYAEAEYIGLLQAVLVLARVGQ